MVQRMLLPLVLFVLALGSVVICVHIETLNTRANSYLPRDFSTDSGKWRYASPIGAREVVMDEIAKKDPSILSRDPTPAEEALLDQVHDTTEKRNDLHEAVSTLGLLQYPLTLLVLHATSWSFLRQSTFLPRALSATALLLTLPCIVLMLYRGYFTSLGW